MGPRSYAHFPQASQLSQPIGSLGPQPRDPYVGRDWDDEEDQRFIPQI